MAMFKKLLKKGTNLAMGDYGPTKKLLKKGTNLAMGDYGPMWTPDGRRPTPPSTVPAPSAVRNMEREFLSGKMPMRKPMAKMRKPAAKMMGTLYR